MQKSTRLAPSPGRLEEPRQATWIRTILAPTLIVGLAYLFILALYPILRGYTSPLDFAHIGQFYCCGGDKTSSGYDGQFFYYMAVDPLHAGAHMDSAPFRYQRILFSIVVWALSLGGQATLAAWWLFILNMVGTLAGTAALALLLQRKGLSPWFSLAFGLYFGQFASITHDVPDGLAAALIVFAALAIDRERWKEATLWLIAAGLTRDTTMIFAGAFALDALFQRRWGRAALLLSSAVPLIIWLIILRLALGKTGLFASTAVRYVFKPPLTGLLSIASTSPRFLITVVVIALPAALALGWVAREIITKQWRTSPGLLCAVGITVVWLVIFLSAAIYGDLTSSTRIVIGLPLGWLLYAALRRSRALLWLATPWTLGVALYAIAVIIPLQSIIP
ncbi:MAG TPA: hypothetical protein VH599_13080 [Ktedonobacterales bacterium]